MTDAAFPSGTPVRPPFDSDLVPVLEAIRQTHPPFSDETLPIERETLLAAGPADLTAAGTVTVSEHQVPGPDGDPDITLLVLSPNDKERGPLPVIYYAHAGGMMMGDRRTLVDAFLPFVASGSAIVVSVEYRLAPEHPDPAPVEDCYAGLIWIARNADELGIDAERIIVVGISAGGGVAAGTALLARDRAFPTLSHQVLICPMLDDRFLTDSSRMLDGDGAWDRNDNLFAWNALLGTRRGGPDVSPYAAPARAENLAGLPRTYIDVGSAESFRDEALTFARRLSEAGVSVDLHMWGGGFHAFDFAAPDAAVSRAARRTREEYIERALRGVDLAGER